MIRFFKDDHEQIDLLRTDEDYQLDLLARDLDAKHQIYLIRRGNFLGEEVTIDPEADILLDLSNKSTEIKNRLSNKKYLHYLSKFLPGLGPLQQKLTFLYSSVTFATGQEGDYQLCLAVSKSLHCVVQGTESYLTFYVDSTTKLSVAIVISIFALALFLSALTGALTLGIMSLDTHELQVLIK